MTTEESTSKKERVERAKRQVEWVIHDYSATVSYDYERLRLHRDVTAEDVVRITNGLPIELGNIHGTQEHSVVIEIERFGEPIECAECDEWADDNRYGEWLCEDHAIRCKLSEDGFTGDLLERLIQERQA